MGNRAPAPARAAPPQLQRFSFEELAAVLPSAAPLPAMPSGAKTLDELEGCMVAGAANVTATIHSGPAVPVTPQPGRPGASLLSLLNRNGREAPGAQQAAPPDAFPGPEGVGQGLALPQGPPGGVSLLAMLQGSRAADAPLQRPLLAPAVPRVNHADQVRQAVALIMLSGL